MLYTGVLYTVKSRIKWKIILNMKQKLACYREEASGSRRVVAEAMGFVFLVPQSTGVLQDLGGGCDIWGFKEWGLWLRKF